MATHADREALKGVKEEYEYGFHDEIEPVFKTERGLSHDVIDKISDQKNEPQWMREFRHQALDIFFPSRCDVGRRPERHQLRRDRLLCAAHGKAGQKLG